MEKWEQVFLKTDFSRETGLKEKLRTQLFGNQLSGNGKTGENHSASGKRILSGRDSFRRLDEDDLALVSAAGDPQAGQGFRFPPEETLRKEQDP